MGLGGLIGLLQGVAALHAVIVAAQERLHAIEQGLAVQIKEEDGEQGGIHAQPDEQNLFRIFNTLRIFFPPYQLWESSNSSRDGSMGSSCMTVVM